MSSVALLLGLLVVAYVGSQLMGGKSVYRLGSGAEYLLLGAALGPYALGAAERSTLHVFQPIAIVGTAWLTLVIGVGYGFREGGRVSAKGVVIGLLLGLLTVAAVGGAVFFVARRLTSFRGHDLVLLSAGVALVGSETTRHAVRWVVGRHAANGRLSWLVEDLTDADDLVPILGIAALFPFIDPPTIAAKLPFWGFALVTPALGIVLGGTAAALLRAEPRAGDGWGVLLGAVLLGTGIAWRVGLAPQAATFALGVALAVLSRHRTELRIMITRSEPAVLLPMLLLAGADVEVVGLKSLAAILGAAFAARLLVRFLVSPVILASSGAKVGGSGVLALGLMPSGALGIALGLAFASRFPGRIGDSILAVSVGLALAGELVGPSSLRRALLRAGEIKEPAAMTPLPEPARAEPST